MKGIANDIAAQVASQFMDKVVMPVLVGTIIAAAIIYLIPTFIALIRRHKNKLAIFLVNLLLGWTIAGWIWALIWSVSSSRKKSRGKKKRKR